MNCIQKPCGAGSDHNIKLLSGPDNIIRVQCMQNILKCRRALMDALNQAVSYGFTEAEVDALYKTEAVVLTNAREWIGSN